MKPRDLIQQLNRIPQDYFSMNDVRKLYRGNMDSLAVTLTRLTHQGLLTRLFRGYYTLHSERVDYESFACVIKKPSYISFESALYHHGFIDQIPESVTLATTGKSQTLSLPGKILEYSHLKTELYFGYEILEGLEMARPEKALLDEFYLIAFKKRSLAMPSEWFHRKSIDRKIFLKWLKWYPEWMQRSLKKIGTVEAFVF